MLLFLECLAQRAVNRYTPMLNSRIKKVHLSIGFDMFVTLSQLELYLVVTS